MKKVKIILSIILLNFLLVGCDSLNQSLQYANMGLGGVCVRTSCRSGYYDNETNEYKMGYAISTTTEGEDISDSEDRWLDIKERETTNTGVGVYYHTSPYSDLSYKFVVDCIEWQQNQ